LLPCCAQDHTTKESRGFAFVRFFDKRDAEVGGGRGGATRRRGAACGVRGAARRGALLS
jgi:hypothetical protein